MFWTKERNRSPACAIPRMAQKAPASATARALEPPSPDWGGAVERIRTRRPSRGPNHSAMRVAMPS
jgi:hypothetical protein